jgi:magnesium chelatase accessory protein
MNARLAWEHDGRTWPNHAASRFVSAASFQWHVQIMGEGPSLLLLHGSGASTHSWRDLAPKLAEHFTVIALDLPGQGFTQPPPASGFSLSGMAQSIAALLHELRVTPALIIGHSAGAAIAIRMAIDGLVAPKVIIGLNAALLPFTAATGPVYSALAKILALNPIVPWAFSRYAGGRGGVERLLQETGSNIDAYGVSLYRKLAGNSAHVSATLRMMANWNLSALERDLPRLKTPLHLLVGSRDRTIAPERAFDLRRLLPQTRVEQLPGLGHLAHEERPNEIADRIVEIARAHAVLGAKPDA